MTTFSATAQQSTFDSTNTLADAGAPRPRAVRPGRPKLANGDWGAIKTSESRSGCWRARARYRDYDGAIHDLARQASDPADARERLVAAMKNYGRMHNANQTATPTMTIAELCAFFISNLEEEGTTSRQTRVGYESVLRRCVIPNIGLRVIKSLDIVDAEQFVQSLKSTGKRSNARSARNLLRRMFDDALRLGLIERNPFFSTKSVLRPTPTPRALTPNQMVALWDAAKAWDRVSRRGPQSGLSVSDVLAVLMGSGCRIGEALALRWDDVDLSGPVPTVRFCGTLTGDAKLQRKSSTKTEAGMRTVPIPSALREVLVDRKSRSTRNGPDDAVFSTSKGTWISPSNFGRIWRRVRGNAGDVLGEDLTWVTPHSLRRTVATRIFEVHGLEAASGQLGHSSTAVTARHYVERNTIARPDMSGVTQMMFTPDTVDIA